MKKGRNQKEGDGTPGGVVSRACIVMAHLVEKMKRLPVRYGEDGRGMGQMMERVPRK